MGCRGNVIVSEGAEQVCLYTHWTGDGLPALVTEVIARGERWNDPPYLARMIFSRMLRGDLRKAFDGDELLEETGFGIWQTVLDESNNPTIYVDCVKQTVKRLKRTLSFEAIRGGAKVSTAGERK